MRSNHIHLFCSLLLLLSLPASPLNTDGTLLLSFKYSILTDPLSALDNWDYNDVTPCLWTGITCGRVVNAFGFPEMMRVVGLSLPNSKLLGSIPEDLGVIPHLKTVDLSSNFFHGALPKSFFNASQLQLLDLSGNALSGSIPELTTDSLYLVNLSENALVGNVPLSIMKSQNLTVVSLRRNYLSGRIPSGIQSLQVLDLSSNLLNGSLPADFGGSSLRYLNLSSNQLAGSVPPTFASKIPANATIDISYNHLAGEIPASMPLSNQRTEAYAGNADLCGKPLNKLCTIPSSLSAPPNVTSNTASSAAIAAIPKTIGSTNSADTPQSGDQITAQHGLTPGAIAGIAVVPLAAVGVLAALFVYMYQKKKNGASNEDKLREGSIPTAKAYEFKKDSEAKVVKETRSLPSWPCLTTNGEETSEAASSDSDENSGNYVADDSRTDNQKQQIEKSKNARTLMMVDGESELDVETLFKASAYVLGSSGATIVYKAVLQDGTAFAVRRVGESGVGKLKEFEHQVKAITKLRHQNLVKVRGFYWGEDEKLVIYDYVSNGSLGNIGSRKTGSSPYHLPFQTRLKIAKGVARGLTYIHDKKNVHGNIKPSNILLTEDMEPLISDFGLHWLVYGKHTNKPDASARHFGSKRSTASHEDLHDTASPYIGPAGFVGCTSPYHAPESLNNHKPHPKWDVYSFGVLLLELLTGKVFSERELSQWTAGSVEEDPVRVLQMCDVGIRGDVAGQEEAMVAWFKLGLSCASLVPQKRPCMREAHHVMEKIPCVR